MFEVVQDLKFIIDGHPVILFESLCVWFDVELRLYLFVLSVWFICDVEPLLWCLNS